MHRLSRKEESSTTVTTNKSPDSAQEDSSAQTVTQQGEDVKKKITALRLHFRRALASIKGKMRH